MMIKHTKHVNPGIFLRGEYFSAFDILKAMGFTTDEAWFIFDVVMNAAINDYTIKRVNDLIEDITVKLNEYLESIQCLTKDIKPVEMTIKCVDDINECELECVNIMHVRCKEFDLAFKI